MQQTAKLQELTQNRLSTGLRVNSAIDNSSSYYTAVALNNRASDLSALLDAMSQGIQTLKAAQQGLQTASTFLEQAKSVANQALEFAPIELSKNWFEAEAAKQSGVVVSTVAELQQAIDDNKALIVVYGKIDFQDTALKLKENQKLVGTEYFANIDKNALYRTADGKRISELNFENSGARLSGIWLENNTLVSDLTINCTNLNGDATDNTIVLSTDNKAELKNVNISLNLAENDKLANRSAIHVAHRSVLNLSGNINIETSGQRSNGIMLQDSSLLNVSSDAKINIKASGRDSFGLYLHTHSAAKLNGDINIYTTSHAIFARNSQVGDDYSGNILNVAASASLFMETVALDAIVIGENGNSTPDFNQMIIEKGAKIGMKYQDNISWREAYTKFEDINSSDGLHSYRWSTPMVGLEAATSWSVADFDEIFADAETKENKFQRQYQSILSQYDMLIQDSGYKGINLLDGNSLTINFNEERSSYLHIKGRDASFRTLGLTLANWENQWDINKSIGELDSAISQIRSLAQELGNTYSVVSTREDFTNKLINVLTEGADKLTLADMNEESANSLMLETRQNLAINALSLASQTSRSILKLF